MAKVTQMIEVHPLTEDLTKACSEMQSDKDLHVLEVDVK